MQVIAQVMCKLVSRGPVVQEESTRVITGSQRGDGGRGVDAVVDNSPRQQTSSRCSRHQLSNCSRYLQAFIDYMLDWLVD